MMNIQELVAKEFAKGSALGEKHVAKTIPAQARTVGYVQAAIKTEGQIVKAVYIQTMG